MRIVEPGIKGDRFHYPEPMRLIAWCEDCKAHTDMLADADGTNVQCVHGHTRPDIERELQEQAYLT